MTVTLETLRADFKKARLAHLKERIKMGGCDHNSVLKWHSESAAQWISDTDEWPADLTLAQIAWFKANREPPTAQFVRSIQAANILDVAEKHGLRAAMAYKLSDGAIDPRKAVQP